jgi:menaquinone-9 beta-reductase
MQLAAAGLRVVCIEPEEAIRQAAGESLDWSAPDLLNALGLPMEDLVRGGLATWKRHVTVKLRDGASEHYVPGAWLANAPFRVELRTMHVDRLRLDEELLKRTLASGVTVVRDTVVKVERDGDKVAAVHTAGGARFSSPWFIDASGFASSLLPR